jgi:hypothetical protein
VSLRKKPSVPNIRWLCPVGANAIRHGANIDGGGDDGAGPRLRC